MGRARDRDADRYDDDDLPRRRRDRAERDDDDPPPRRRSRSESDEDDLPRRRRERSDPDEVDDRPRRRRESADDEEGERPRRRRSRGDDFDFPGERPRRRTSDGGSMVPILIWVGVGAVVLLAVGIGFWIYQAQWAALRKNMGTYLAAATGRPTQGAPAGAGKKMVVVNVATKDVDSLHTYLANNERADKPEQVSLVAQVNWQENKVGQYTSGGSAYRTDCTVTVIDLSTGQQVAIRNFRGGDPPASFVGRRGTSKWGTKPHDEVLSFLRTYAGK